MEQQHRDVLLAIARESIMETLTAKPSPTLAKVSARVPAQLSGEEGAFVTLKRRSVAPGAEGSLRGCIGNILGQRPLYRLVHRLAKESAFHDPRFAPVRLEEMIKLRIELSILTVPAHVDRPDEIVIGRDGVLLTLGLHRAVFLPQVALEQGWDRQQMLDHLAVKAGLPPATWQQKECRFEIFQAEIFEEA